MKGIGLGFVYRSKWDQVICQLYVQILKGKSYLHLACSLVKKVYNNW